MLRVEGQRPMSKTFQVALVLFLFAVADGRQPAMAADPAVECGQFVQKFYDWYIVREKELRDSPKDVMEVAMKEKRSCFSPELLKALQEDVTAAHKSPGEIVGLDFDPILNSQEYPGRYVVAKVHARGDFLTPRQQSPSLALSGSGQMLNVAYLVDVFDVRDGKKEAKPTVTPELVSKNGHWIFTNFHYEKDNLLNVLEQLKKERSTFKKGN